MKPPPPLEHDSQSAFFDLVYRLEDRYPALKLVFAIPNGAHKSISQRMKFKREGLRAGIPDIFCAISLPPSGSRPDYGVCGLWIEMKRKGNKQSEEQVWYSNNLIAEGYEYRLCYTAEEAWAALRDYLKPVCDLPEFK